MKTIFKLKALSIASLLYLSSSPVWANQIVLEGSDATSFHHDGTYTSQLFTYMQGSSSDPTLPVLVMGTGGTLSGAFATDSSKTVYNSTYSLSGFILSDYSGLYIQSPGGCCGAPDGSTSISLADQAAIALAETKGMSLTIQNYGGCSATITLSGRRQLS